MNLLIFTLILQFSFFSHAKILCFEGDTFLNGKCNTQIPNQFKNQHDKKVLSNVSTSVESFFKNNCITKDRSCISDVKFDYCDTDMKTCLIYGEIKYDTGTYDIFRLIYDEQDIENIKVSSINKVGFFEYNN